MVGRVPLCVHGAGETKTGSLSTPGAEEGWGFLVQLLEGPRPAPCSPPQGRSLEVGGRGRQGGQLYELGEGSQSQDLTPPQQSHESPRPSLTSKQVGRKKGPRQWGWVPAAGNLCICLLPGSVPICVFPSSLDGKSGKAAQWDIVPLSSYHCLLLPLPPIHPLPCSLGVG